MEPAFAVPRFASDLLRVIDRSVSILLSGHLIVPGKLAPSPGPPNTQLDVAGDSCATPGQFGNLVLGKRAPWSLSCVQSKIADGWIALQLGRGDLAIDSARSRSVCGEKVINIGVVRCLRP